MRIIPVGPGHRICQPGACKIWRRGRPLEARTARGTKLSRLARREPFCARLFFLKAGESWGQYFKRIGTKVFLPSVAVEAGEKLKTEGEQKESFGKMDTETEAVKTALAVVALRIAACMRRLPRTSTSS